MTDRTIVRTYLAITGVSKGSYGEAVLRLGMGRHAANGNLQV